jgi:hypothetical protein
MMDGLGYTVTRLVLVAARHSIEQVLQTGLRLDIVHRLVLSGDGASGSVAVTRRKLAGYE